MGQTYLSLALPRVLAVPAKAAARAIRFLGQGALIHHGRDIYWAHEGVGDAYSG